MIELSRPTELSPAQKAWATRKARSQARSAIEVRKTGIATASPLAGEKIVQLFSEDGQIGYGNRLFVVIEIGPKLVTLFYVPRLCTTRIDRATFDQHAKRSPASSCRKTVALIKRTMATWRECFKPEDHEPACERAVRAITILQSKSEKAS